ncbi:MAG: hypothetical protein SPI15_06640, partial [Candidatus Faecousia sp.]|nr:hypothetical protein [Candidatus Faecousia sp.]
RKAGIVTVLGGNCYLIPFNRGIATPVCALARNDSVFSAPFQTPIFLFPVKPGCAGRHCKKTQRHPKNRQYTFCAAA